MPRVSRGPHLYLKKRSDGEAFWYIRDGKLRIATGCYQRDAEAARAALESHIGKTARPSLGNGDPARVGVAAVIALYATDIVPGLARPAEAMTRLQRLNEFFGLKSVMDVTPSTCAAYTRWRTHAGTPERGEPERRARAVTGPSARRELADLQSALNHAWKSRKLIVKIPVDLPNPSQPRERWLTRSEAARLLLGCLGFRLLPACDIRTRRETWVISGRRRDSINRHAARFVMLGLHTGTRHEAILSLGWRQHFTGGWADVDRGLIYRRAASQAETKKRRPPVPLSEGLVRHLRRWRASDPADSLFVVAWKGEQIGSIRKAFGTAAELAGLDDAVTPHVLRHTCTTWLVQAGVPLWEVAGFVGMTVEIVERVYGHHSPEHLQRARLALR